MKFLACDSVCDLIIVLESLKMWTPLKRVILLCLKMISDGGDQQTQLRDEALEYLFTKLFDLVDNI